MKWNPEDTPNFTAEEMSCKCGHCGGLHDMDRTFMLMLQGIRTTVGFALPVISGFRCPHHPEEIVKAQPGAHSVGLAVDIGGLTAEQRFKVLEVASMVGIGVSKTIIHLDNGHPCMRRPALWGY